MSKKGKLNKEVLSIDYEDNQDSYKEFDKFITEHTERQKRKTASDIVELGETFIQQIEHKRTVKEKAKKPLIKYIVKKSNKYSEQYLLDLDYDDVLDIHTDIKYQNRSIFKKFWDFISPI